MKAITTFLSAAFWNIVIPVQKLLTNVTGIQYVSLSLTLASAILAYGATHQAITGVPGWMAADWPFVLAGAGIVARYGHILFPAAQIYTATQIQQAVTAHLQTPAGQAIIQAAVAAQPPPPLNPFTR